MRFLINFIFILLLPITGLANTLCKPVSHLDKGFNVEDYRTCHHRLYLCPHLKNSPFLDQACIKRTIQLNKFCTQLHTLSNVVEADPTFLTIKDYRGKVAIIKVHYAADGSENYYILTSKKCLIKTALDPRQLDTELKNRYKSFNFYTENDGEPKVKLHNDGSVTISVPIKVTNTCRACEIILKSNIQYNFAPSGNLVNANLTT